MTIIYVLQLEEGKYYVGKTGNLGMRIEQHRNGSGADFTRRYKYVDLIEQIETDEPFMEDVITKRYMKRYGIDNVRGGTYVQFELPESYRQTLAAEFKTIDNVCFGCGKSGHFVAQCNKGMASGVLMESNKRNMIRENYVETFGDRSDRFIIPKTRTSGVVRGNCYRCGRPGHYINNCHARTDINGDALEERPVKSGCLIL